MKCHLLLHTDKVYSDSFIRVAGKYRLFQPMAHTLKKAHCLAKWTGCISMAAETFLSLDDSIASA